MVADWGRSACGCVGKLRDRVDWGGAGWGGAWTVSVYLMPVLFEVEVAGKCSKISCGMNSRVLCHGHAVLCYGLQLDLGVW